MKRPTCRPETRVARRPETRVVSTDVSRVFMCRHRRRINYRLTIPDNSHVVTGVVLCGTTRRSDSRANVEGRGSSSSFLHASLRFFFPRRVASIEMSPKPYDTQVGAAVKMISPTRRQNSRVVRCVSLMRPTRRPKTRVVTTVVSRVFMCRHRRRINYRLTIPCKSHVVTGVRTNRRPYSRVVVCARIRRSTRRRSYWRSFRHSNRPSHRFGFLSLLLLLILWIWILFLCQSARGSGFFSVIVRPLEQILQY
jgi:hypothetical protein